MEESVFFLQSRLQSHNLKEKQREHLCGVHAAWKF